MIKDKAVSPGAKPPIAALAALQFSASLWIVSRHYSYFLRDDFPQLYTLLSRVTFTDLFFVLSGFFLQYINGDRERMPTVALITRQIGKLYPLHLLTLLFFLSVLAMQALQLFGPVQSRSGWECVLPHLTLLHAWGLLEQHCLNYPSWFLSALFAMYLSYPLIHGVIRRFGTGPIIVLLVAITATYEIAHRLGGTPHWTTLTYNFGVLRGIPTFLSGVLIACYLPAFKHRVRSFWPAYGAYGLTLGGMMLAVDPLLSYAILQVALVALVAAAEANGVPGFIRRPQLARLGRYSFPLYLLHVPVATTVMTFLVVRILKLDGFALAGAVIATVAVAVATAVLFETGLQRLRRTTTRDAGSSVRTLRRVLKDG